MKKQWMIKNADVMKNVFFPILRIAAAASAILLFALCNKSDIVPDDSFPEDSPSDVINVSVNATVASIDVKSTFDDNRITIESGDKLLVEAYHKDGESYAYYYSGTLTNTESAPGIFSGVLERDTAYGPYSGSDILLDAAADATLLPKDADPSVEFIEGLSDDNVAKLCTMKATKAEGDDPIFALKPSVSVARFTVTGLGGINGPTAYILVKYIDNNDVEHSVEGSATVSGSGVAEFSVGIHSTGSVKSLTLGVHGGTDGYHINNRVWYDGIIIASEEKSLSDIINISRTVTKTKYANTTDVSNPDTFDSGDIGKIFATNGHLFSSVASAKAAGADPLCMLTCLKSMFANPGYAEGTDVQMQNGLAIGLYPMEVDGVTKFIWNDIRYSGRYRHCDSGVTLACEGMPKIVVLQRMAKCCGSNENFITYGTQLMDNRISYNSRGLAELLAPAINAANGTNYTWANLVFWVNAYHTVSRVDYPFCWTYTGFDQAGAETKFESYAYYMF